MYAFAKHVLCRSRNRNRVYVWVVVLAVMLVVPATSYAANFWYGAIPAHENRYGPDPAHGVRAVYGYSDGSNHKVAVGLVFYAQLAENWFYACHPYAEPHSDIPVINNPHSVTQNPMQGYWSTDNACSSPSAATEAVASVSSKIATNFEVFREQPAARMPADVAASLASPTRFGRNASLAREIPTTNGVGWVVPGDGFLCLIVPDPVEGYATGCDTVEHALVRGLVLTLRDGPRGPGSAAALMPDRARAALSDGSLPLRSDDGIVNSSVAADEDLVVTPAKD